MWSFYHVIFGHFILEVTQSHMNKHERWEATWSHLGLGTPDPSFFEHLMDCYAEGHRAYHTFAHIQKCFAAFDTAGQLAEHPAEIELAIWYHDAIYDLRRSDNEEHSAELASRTLREAGASSIIANRVSELILVTQHDATRTESGCSTHGRCRPFNSRYRARAVLGIRAAFSR